MGVQLAVLVRVQRTKALIEFLNIALTEVCGLDEVFLLLRGQLALCVAARKPHTANTTANDLESYTLLQLTTTTGEL